MTEHDDNQLQQEFAAELAAMRRLAAGIDSRRAPVSLWPAKRRAALTMAWYVKAPLALTAAAASVVLAALATVGVLKGPAVGPTVQPQAAAEIVSPWQLPMAVDTAMAGEMTFDVPAVPTPADLGDIGGFEWSLPTITFDLNTERSVENDS